MNEAVGADQDASEDLYTKIALDNKLVTRFQVRKACEEQEALSKQGKELDLGEVMVRLGFLTERHHQSVLNACRYREQRDYDKRFARQVLRMELLDQAALERALEQQKDGYAKSGEVLPLADTLLERGDLDAEQVEAVHKGIQERDRLRKQAKLDKTGGHPALGHASTTTPVLAKGGEAKRPAAKAPADEELEELDEADLGDLEELDDADLDADLGELDGDLGDLDEDLGDLDEDLDADLGDLDDVDLDDDLDEAADGELDADLGELDDVDLDDAELEDDLPAASGEDLDDLDLDDVDAELDADLDDETDLARQASELDSDVRLDESDLKALEELGSGEQLEAEAGWAADAFDDRPLAKRGASERLIVPTEPPIPRPAPAPPAPPELPAAPRAAAPVVAPTPPSPPAARLPEPAIPGGDVFEAELSGSSASSASASAAASRSSSRVEDSVDGWIDDGESGSAEAPLPPPTPSEMGKVELDDELEEEASASAPAAAPAAVVEPAAEAATPEAATPEAATPEAATPEAAAAEPAAEPAPLDEERVRRAFEKAMEAAWPVFLRELGRG